MAYPKLISPWTRPPLLVHEPVPSKICFTVDLRPVSEFNLRLQFLKPLAENELSITASSEHIFNVDFVVGYWQFLLHEKSQVTQSFTTTDVIFSPTRIMHGSTSAVLHLQSTLSSASPSDLNQVLLCWLDDVLSYGQTMDEFLSRLCKYFPFCLKKELKIYSPKSVPYAKSIGWCGRIVSFERKRFDPCRIDVIQNMEKPTTAADLQHYVCAIQWMQNEIPQFSTTIRLLS